MPIFCMGLESSIQLESELTLIEPGLRPCKALNLPSSIGGVKSPFAQTQSESPFTLNPNHTALRPQPLLPSGLRLQLQEEPAEVAAVQEVEEVPEAWTPE